MDPAPASPLTLPPVRHSFNLPFALGLLTLFIIAAGSGYFAWRQNQQVVALTAELTKTKADLTLKQAEVAALNDELVSYRPKTTPPGFTYAVDYFPLEYHDHQFQKIAQTFTPSSSQNALGLRLRVNRIGGTGRLQAALYELSDPALPESGPRLAQGSFDLTQIPLDTPFDLLFASPAVVQTNTQYVLVLSTDDPTGAVSVAYAKVDANSTGQVLFYLRPSGVASPAPNQPFVWSPQPSLDLVYTLL